MQIYTNFTNDETLPVVMNPVFFTGIGITINFPGHSISVGFC